jgi:tellurite resistance protein
MGTKTKNLRIRVDGQMAQQLQALMELGRFRSHSAAAAYILNSYTAATVSGLQDSHERVSQLQVLRVTRLVS